MRQVFLSRLKLYESVDPEYTSVGRRVFYEHVVLEACITSGVYSDFAITEAGASSVQHLPYNRELFVSPFGELGILHGHGNVLVTHELLPFHERDFVGLF